MNLKAKKRSPRNRTVDLTKREIAEYSKKLISIKRPAEVEQILNKTINQNLFDVLDLLPNNFVDLLIIDPPYNLQKYFNTTRFGKKSIEDYAEWIDVFISKLKRTLKQDGTLYFCSDWHSSISVQMILNKYFKIRNRITWEREKGRGSNSNWKNNSEDIWFCTASNKYKFNAERVKLARRVIAPYKDENGSPKDWNKNENCDFRLTYSSNLWTDISVPFWSMPENTIHPTQKPEKLIAKLILASSNKKDIVLDPFLGSGTTSVVAKKLGRNYVGIEVDKYYACLAEKRLLNAGTDKQIQGYNYEVFWERNTKPFPVK